MRYLSCDTYDRVLFFALREQGLSPEQARRLIASRWPMDSSGIISEAAGRGLQIDPADVCAFVEELAQAADATAPDTVLFAPAAAEQFFAWTVSTGRARLTENGRRLQADDAQAAIVGHCRRAHDAADRRDAAPLN